MFFIEPCQGKSVTRLTNTDLDPSGHPYGSYFGPLSGIDYGKQNEIITRGSGQTIGIIGLILAAAALITSWVQGPPEEIEQEKIDAMDRATAIAEREVLLKEFDRYDACKGDAACQNQYPEAKAAKEAAAEKAAGSPKNTSAPEKPAEKKVDDMWAPSIKQDPLPPGSGGGSGELVPWEDQLVRENSAKRLAAPKDWQKHRDPQANARFCERTVKDYKVFATKKITGRKDLAEIPSKSLDPIPTAAFGVVRFEKWDNAYWREQKKSKEYDPEYQAKQNNCHVMDEVQGL